MEMIPTGGQCSRLMPIFGLAALLLLAPLSYSQTSTSASKSIPEMLMASTDFFVMFGSDFNRPGLLPRANYSVGVGHKYGFLKKNPFGNELIVSYMYENAGMHGFFKTAFGEHTESVGTMRNVAIPKARALAGYTWVQGGITSFTGNAHVSNRLASSAALGLMIRVNRRYSIWIQESFNKVVTVPWYTTTSIAYVYSR